ncbi:MAG: hypothetical protein D6695_02300 [Planctomycetota bacterium]|nr:MAG: hypothetical protein D6695_02300 [Planctomycetota bacterium]
MTRTLRTLLEGLIDYAGLFPPARLDMQPAVENYNRYLIGNHTFALGRFICPVSRLDDLTRHASALMPGTFATSGYREMADSLPPWPISAIIDGPLDASLARIDAFNELHQSESAGLARIETIELKIAHPNEIDDALDIIPNDIKPYFEIPAESDPRGCIAALAGQDAGAKIRCGGVRPEMIPSIDAVAAFIAACASADVPFKATAGLHHPIRAEHPLTYEQNPPRAVMHGFVNVFLTAALLKEQTIDESQARSVLAENDPAAFHFDDERASWREHALTLDGLTRARTRFAVGYGSCSFEEPIADLITLGWMSA